VIIDANFYDTWDEDTRDFVDELRNYLKKSVKIYLILFKYLILSFLVILSIALIGGNFIFFLVFLLDLIFCILSVMFDKQEPHIL